MTKPANSHVGRSDESGDIPVKPKHLGLRVLTPRFFRTSEAGVYLGLSPRTLEKHRTYGTGPVYRKLGGRIVYSVADLDAWAELGLRRSTSDPGTGVVHPARRMDGYTPPVRR